MSALWWELRWRAGLINLGLYLIGMKNWKTTHCKQYHSVQTVLPSFSSVCGVLGSSFIRIPPVRCSAIAKGAVGWAVVPAQAGGAAARLLFPPAIAPGSAQHKVGVQEATLRHRVVPWGPWPCFLIISFGAHAWLPRLFRLSKCLLLTKGTNGHIWRWLPHMACAMLPRLQCLRRKVCCVQPILSLRGSRSSFWHSSLTAANKSTGWQKQQQQLPALGFYFLHNLEGWIILYLSLLMCVYLLILGFPSLCKSF